MKTTVIITNYNYESYVCDAIESVLQNEGDFLYEIIVVDDGSTDNSVSIIREKYAQNDKVKLIVKENGGMFSCFRRGTELAKGDIICFLDADDCYTKNYFSRVISVYQESPYVDYVATGYKNYGRNDDVVLKYKDSIELGVRSVKTGLVGGWIGVITSVISMRKSLAKRIMALPEYMDWEWMRRADTVLEVGATIIGGYQYYLAEVLMMRRTHESNGSLIRSKELNYKAHLAVRRLMRFYVKEFNIRYDQEKFLKQEFKMLPVKDEKTFEEYFSAAKQMDVGALGRIRLMLFLYRYRFLK